MEAPEPLGRVVRPTPPSPCLLLSGGCARRHRLRRRRRGGMQHVAAVAGEESDARVGKSSGIGLGVDGCRWRLGWLSSPTHGVEVPRRDLPATRRKLTTTRSGPPGLPICYGADGCCGVCALLVLVVRWADREGRWVDPRYPSGQRGKQIT